MISRSVVNTPHDRLFSKYATPRSRPWLTNVEVGRPRRAEQALEQLQRRVVGPLQVVEEHHQRVVALREHPDQPLDQRGEPAVRLRRRQLGDRGLRADQLLERGDHVDQHPAVGPGDLEELRLPRRDALAGLGEDRLDHLVERLADRRVRDAAVELIELARDE
jgi:hypothetical protein